MKSTKTVLTSLLMVGLVAALLGGATYAVFSDTETSVGNQMIAGTIDFEVDGDNPYMGTAWSDDLGDMKPCVVHYGKFDIRNVGVNPMKLYKRLTIDYQDGGIPYYHQYASSEPEYAENGGLFEVDLSGKLSPTGLGYDERCNLASYTLYDMTVTVDGVSTVIIDHANQVRIDNVNGVWIYLGELAPDKTMTVNQSYHLSSWDGASEDSVTNWAQGDVMVFDVELYGEQLTGVGPNLATGTLVLRAKDTTTWVPRTGTTDPYGVLTFERSAAQFTYDFDATYLDAATSYTLIYYPDGVTPNVGATIGTAMSNGDGAISIPTTSVELDMDLPIPADTNSPAGAKIWLVPTSDIKPDGNLKWGMNNYLFEMNLITYDDTEV